MSGGMWVVSNMDTGNSDESMRFATHREAEADVFAREASEDNVFGYRYTMRYESESQHPQNHVAVGQILVDGKWMDYARDTPEAAIRWAKREPAGEARVVDWIGKRHLIWPDPD